MQDNVGFADAFPSCYAIAARVGYRVLGSAAEAEDVAQEAMTRAFLRWRRIQDHAEPWVSTVALRIALDRTRRLAHERRNASQALLESDEEQRILLRLDLGRALSHLPRRQREAIACRYLADLSTEATASYLGITQGAVKQHVSRGLATLRIAYEPQEESHDVTIL